MNYTRNISDFQKNCVFTNNYFIFEKSVRLLRDRVLSMPHSQLKTEIHKTTNIRKII